MTQPLLWCWTASTTAVFFRATVYMWLFNAATSTAMDTSRRASAETATDFLLPPTSSLATDSVFSQLLPVSIVEAATSISMAPRPASTVRVANSTSQALQSASTVKTATCTSQALQAANTVVRPSSVPFHLSREPPPLHVPPR